MAKQKVVLDGEKRESRKAMASAIKNGDFLNTKSIEISFFVGVTGKKQQFYTVYALFQDAYYQDCLGLGNLKESDGKVLADSQARKMVADFLKRTPEGDVRYTPSRLVEKSQLKLLDLDWKLGKKCWWCRLEPQSNDSYIFWKAWKTQKEKLKEQGISLSKSSAGEWTVFFPLKRIGKLV